MKHVVITGGTRGIGYGMVREFLIRGFNVTFCGTTDRSVMNAMSALTEQWSSKNFRGVVCDVSKKEDLINLWDFGTKIFGDVDIWINNAGISNNIIIGDGNSHTGAQNQRFIGVMIYIYTFSPEISILFSSCIDI